MSSDIFSIILAAGKGNRMKSNSPKVLHEVCGKPMIRHVIDNLSELQITDNVVVVGHKYNEVINNLGDDQQYVIQQEQLGTAHAVMQAESILKEKQGITIVLSGDTPLITKDTLVELIKHHNSNNVAATILTAEVTNPTGYGRIIRNDNNFVLKIVEEKDANINEKQIREINSGIYCFDNKKLFDGISKIGNNNKQREYYLTDIIELFNNNGEKIAAYKTMDYAEIIGVNDRLALAQAEKILRNRILNNHMINGVTIIDPANTYIEKDVKIGCDTIIYPGSYIKGETVIRENCIIGPDVDLLNVSIEDNVLITHSVVKSSTVKNNAKIGPFAYIRPGSVIGDSVKIGDFVEVKNSVLGKGTKVSHLTYIGDADLGEEINIGCGTVTVNYDGYSKHRTKIGDKSFIGCNSNLIAPISVGRNSYIAAGSTITNDISDNSFAIARERQINKENYAKIIKQKKHKK